MTPAPLTAAALVEARELVRQSLKGGAPGLTDATREAVVGSIMLKLTNKVLAPFLAAHQQVTAERDEARAENDRFRAGLANGSGPCVYCDLSSEDWSKCRSGFPGCGRADDAMLCPHFGAEMEANDRADTAEAELARLRAEGEAKDRAHDDALMALKVYVESGHGGAMCEVREWLRAGAQGPVPFYDGALFRMWAKANGIVSREGFLARAATAREGA